MIIDSHVHISNLGEEEKNLLDVKAELLESMKKYGIDYSIVIPDNVPNPKCADMETLPEIVRDEVRLFQTGTINTFGDIDGQIVQLEALLIAKKICAIKLFPGHDAFYPTDESCQSVYELCTKYDVPVIIHTGMNTGDVDCAKYNDPKYAVEIAKRYGSLKIVLAHFFWPKMEYCFEVTKDIPSIYYDTSAMADSEVVELSGGWDKVVEVLKKTVLQKPNNVVFGSDWPMCPVGEHIRLIKELNVGAELEEKIFSANAINLYKLRINAD